MDTSGLSLVYFLLLLVSGGDMSSSKVDQRIETEYDAIKVASSQDDRVVHMRKLYGVLSQLGPKEIRLVRDESVDKVADLLDIDSDVGIYYGANALGALGCRAQRALPRLRDALKRANPVRSEIIGVNLSPSVSAYDQVVSAIFEIEKAGSCE